MQLELESTDFYNFNLENKQSSFFLFIDDLKVRQVTLCLSRDLPSRYICNLFLIICGSSFLCRSYPRCSLVLLRGGLESRMSLSP